MLAAELGKFPISSFTCSGNAKNSRFDEPIQ